MSVIIKSQHIAEFLTPLLIILLIKMLDLLHELFICERQCKGQLLQLEIIVLGALHFLVILGVEEAGLADHGEVEGAAGVVADDDIGGHQELLHILVGAGVQNAVCIGQRVVFIADIGMHPYQNGPAAAKAFLKRGQELAVVQIVHIGLAAVPVGGGVEGQLRAFRQAEMLMHLSDIGRGIFKINVIFRYALFQNRTIIPEGFPVGFALPAAAASRRSMFFESIFA